MVFIRSIINTERNISHRKETWEGEFSKEKAIMIEKRKGRQSSETSIIIAILLQPKAFSTVELQLLQISAPKSSYVQWA